MAEGKKIKGRVCVTGGTGFLGSWTVKRLLQDGYFVNTTVRIDPDRKRDISYLTKLPGAKERLQIFNADLKEPNSFAAAIQGCSGVFHIAHPLDFEGRETEQVRTKTVVTGVESIIKACVDSKTVKRIVYTSTISAVAICGKEQDRDESCWTDVDLVRSKNMFLGPYIVTKVFAEKAAIELAEKHGVDLVSVLPTWISGPFICPNVPDTVHVSLAPILGDKSHYHHLKSASFVHVDDVARAHIHLLEYPQARGRYLCAAVEFTIDELCEFISARYPQFKDKMPTEDEWKDLIPYNLRGISNKKLKETGFMYENGLEEIFDGAIKCCKERGILN